eukprot:gb/GFBE01029992.1/.p1 GENE.gb/GFBE01029992.1/~~gb/GFBE01029992.1/.p1  ORF type:complete len:547 (+),score=88.02 gb/GFBE01029992.1/:1-1641(+)
MGSAMPEGDAPLIANRANESEHGIHPTPEYQRPIHQVAKSNIPLKPCASDPYGIRAREDITRCDHCPMRQLAGLDDMASGPAERDSPVHNKLHKEVEETLEAVTKDVKKFHEVLKEGQGTKDASIARERLEEHFQSVAQWKEGKNEELTFAAKFAILVDIYSELAKNPFIRKGSAYKRQLPESEVKDPERYGTSKFRQAWYIAFPCVLFFFCFAFQSFMLHVSTSLYVRYMDLGPPERKDSGGQLFDIVSHLLAKYFVVSHGDWDEQGAVLEGRIHVPMAILDISGIIPLVLMMAAYAQSAYQGKFNIGLWVKTFLVASCMAVMKGIFDVATTLPDSIGWRECTHRLGDAGLEQMRSYQDVFDDLAQNFVEAITNEIAGDGSGHRIRYCADMMISGHTYFAALFALSAYKQFDTLDWSKMVRRLVFGVLSACVVIEMVLVAAARFHYTVDMLASIVLVLLLWDSCSVEQVAADWSEGFEWRDPGSFKPRTSLQQFLISGLENGKKPEVLPSQASNLVNMRLLAGSPPWASATDIELDPEAQPLVGP